MEWTGILLGAASLAAGGILKGATGAGTPIIGVPLLAMLYDVPTAVAIFTLPNLISNLWQSWRYRAHRAPPLLTWGFAVAGAVGAGIGSFLLVTLSADALILAVSTAVFLYIGFRLARPGWTLGMGTGRLLAVPAGLVGGVLQGAAGVSAPVSITFLNALRLDRADFIATISLFFLAMVLVQIPLLAAWGVLTGPRALLSLAAIAPLLVAMPVGSWLAQRVSRETFDRLILALLAVIAARLLVGVFV